MKTYARYFSPGAFFSETEVKEVDPIAPEQDALRRAPEHAFCFVLFEKEDGPPPEVGPEWSVSPKEINVTSRRYIGGTLFHIDEIDPLNNRILLVNAKNNHWDWMIKCRTGNWQPFDPTTEVVLSPPS